MAKCLVQLVAWILPPAALPIALPISLSVVTSVGAMEATEIWSGHYRSVASTAELVGTPTCMETTPAAAKVSKGMALRNKGRRRCARRGQ